MLRICLPFTVVLSLGFPISAHSDDDLTPAKAKELIPAAAGLPAKELAQLGETTDPSKIRMTNGDSITWLVMNYAPDLDTPKNVMSFRFFGETISAAAVAKALLGPKDKDGKGRSYASVIHPEYITDCTCKVDGNTATGTVTFKVEKLYEGKFEYTAQKKAGLWRIEEFRAPDLKLTTTLNDKGKWMKK